MLNGLRPTAQKTLEKNFSGLQFVRRENESVDIFYDSNFSTQSSIHQKAEQRTV